MNSTNNTNNTNNNAGVANASPFNQVMTPAEIAGVSIVTDSFLRKRFSATCEAEIHKLDSIVQSVFDSEMLKLNANADLRLRLNYVCLMTIEIASNYINSKAFIERLYKDYELETLFQIYKKAVDEQSLRMGLPALPPVELPYCPQRYLNISHLIRVDERVVAQKINPLWEELEDSFSYGHPTKPMGLAYESASIDTNFQSHLGKTRDEVEDILGDATSLYIALKCILSKAIVNKEATLLPLFSIPTYYAAKAFAYIFPLIPVEEQNLFIALVDLWDQEKALINLILDDTKPYTETIRNEYIEALVSTYPTA